MDRMDFFLFKPTTGILFRINQSFNIVFNEFEGYISFILRCV